MWLLSALVLKICPRLHRRVCNEFGVDREDSRRASIDYVMWLLVITLMQICNGKKQVGKREIQNIQFEEKRNKYWKCNDGTMSCARGDKTLTEKSDAKWNCRGPCQRSSELQLKPPGVSPAEGNPMMGQSHLGKVTGLQIPECLLFLLCPLHLPQLSFSGT